MQPTFRKVLRYMASGNHLNRSISDKNISVYTQPKQFMPIEVISRRKTS